MTPNYQASRKPHKFFDSEPQPAGRPTTSGLQTPKRGIPSPKMTPTHSVKALPGIATPPSEDHQQGSTLAAGSSPDGKRADGNVEPPEPKVLAVPAGNWVVSAHYGYIYCIALVQDHESRSPLITARREGKKAVQLVTGSGDEDVKVSTSPTLPSTVQLAFIPIRRLVALVLHPRPVRQDREHEASAHLSLWNWRRPVHPIAEWEHLRGLSGRARQDLGHRHQDAREDADCS